MDTSESSYSSWGKPSDHLDVRALRRYNSMLNSLARTGEVMVYVLAIAIVACFLWFLFYGNFENAIFTDGTSLSCIYDGENGEIVDVNK